MVEALWRLVRGASNAPRPAPAEIGRRYVDVLTDNFGQPGFREVLVGVHDLDARRDLVGAVLARRRAQRSRRGDGAGPREAEIGGFHRPRARSRRRFPARRAAAAGGDRAAAMQFPADSYWRGELHGVCDRPELAVRLVDEVGGHRRRAGHSRQPRGAAGHRRTGCAAGRSTSAAGSASSSARSRPPRSQDAWSGRGALLRRLRDSARSQPDRAVRFRRRLRRGVRSAATMAELMQQGYDDAYRQFIEPMVAAEASRCERSASSSR